MGWAIGKRRRAGRCFLGVDEILRQLEEGHAIKRVRIIFFGPPPRCGSQVLCPNGQILRQITSRGFSPFLKKNIGMGYVSSGFHKIATQLKIAICSKYHDTVIAKMLLVPTKYSRRPKD